MASKYYVRVLINKPYYEVSSITETREKNKINVSNIEEYFSNFPPEEKGKEWDLEGFERFDAKEIKLPLWDSNPTKEKLKNLAWYAFWWKLFTNYNQYFY